VEGELAREISRENKGKKSPREHPYYPGEDHPGDERQYHSAILNEGKGLGKGRKTSGQRERGTIFFPEKRAWKKKNFILLSRGREQVR